MENEQTWKTKAEVGKSAEDYVNLFAVEVFLCKSLCG